MDFGANKTPVEVIREDAFGEQINKLTDRKKF